MNPISFLVPIKTQSTSNLREHWGAKAKRVDAQKRATRAKCPAWTSGPLLTVTLTRVAPRRLDDDNLRGALKSVRDAVASWLRVDDASPLVRWEYAQGKGTEPRVRVAVIGATQPPPAVGAWTGEMATVENSLLPAPLADRMHARYAEACERDGEKIAATPPAPRAISPANPPEYEATGEPTLATQMDRKKRQKRR